MLLDAYAPGLTNNVQRLCRNKGYIVVAQGCGTSMLLQTNDVCLHKDVRSDFIDMQTAEMLHKARTQGGGVADCTAEENLTIMTKVMSNTELHLKAARAYKHTGTTNALDGSEDDLITGDAKVFWDELNMRQIINEEVQEVER